MSQFVGVWVDHQGAWIFKFNQHEDTYAYFPSEFDRVHVSKGAANWLGRSCRSYSGTRHHLEHKKQEKLRHFYRELKGLIQGAQKIAIMGPGLAKKELKKALGSDLEHRVCSVKPAQ